MEKSKKHRKHAKLPLRRVGKFGANEVALVGTPCSRIQELATRLISALSNHWNVGYVDADHASFDNPQKGAFIENGAHVYLSDKNETEQVNRIKLDNPFQRQIELNDCDLLLINGNHFEAEHQILFLDSTKVKSIEKRVSQLTNVIAIVEVDTEVIPDLVKQNVQGIGDIPRFTLNDTQALQQFITEWMRERIPVINALILTGGKSTRMGTDKASLVFENQTQVHRLQQLLESSVNQVFVSCRKDQVVSTDLEKIYDSEEGMGPLGGIKMAFRSHPNHAWLVVACDLPLIDEEVIEELISQRSVKHTATAFFNNETGFAEPLISIWEPKSYMRIMEFEALGYTCPRKMLINSNTRLIKPTVSQKLMNVNTPEDLETARKLLAK